MPISLESWPRWEDRRTAIREARNIGTRRFEFKKLTDKKKLDALPAFLAAADQLDGLLRTIVFDKSIDTLFEQQELGYSSAPLYPSFTVESLKRARLIVHFVSMVIAGVVRAHQNVTWISDEDEIAANAQRMSDLGNLWATVLQACVNCPLGDLKCGTTGIDSGVGDIEDLVSLPDLAAGALADFMTGQQVPVQPGIVVPLTRSARWKVRLIMKWLGRESAHLRKFPISIHAGADGALDVSIIQVKDVPYT